VESASVEHPGVGDVILWIWTRVNVGAKRQRGGTDGER